MSPLNNEQIVTRLEELIRDIKAEAPTGGAQVSNTQQLQLAIRNARDGEVINLDEGTYTNTVLEGKHIKPIIINAHKAKFMGTGNPTITTKPPIAGIIINGGSYHHESNLGDVIRIDAPTREEQAREIVLDGILIDAPPERGQKRGLSFNGIFMTLSKSKILNCKRQGQDSQAVFIYNGEGPYFIIENQLEATGENILVGGATPTISGVVPSNIMIRKNIIRKPKEWLTTEKQLWDNKNLVEFKSGDNCLVEENVLDGNAVDAQPGYAVVITPRIQDGKAAWLYCKSITFRNNLLVNMGAAFNISGEDDDTVHQKSPEGATLPAHQQTEDIVLENNFAFLEPAKFGGSGIFCQFGRTPHGIQLYRNTSISPATRYIYIYGQLFGPSKRNRYVDNVFQDNRYGLMAEGSGDNPKKALGLPWQENPEFMGNVIGGGSPNAYPAGNYFPTLEELSAQFNSDFSLKPGKDWSSKGVDMSKLPKYQWR